MKDNQETILCAAIWIKGIERAYHRPINTPGGVVVCGYRHTHCISQIVALMDKKLHEFDEHIQGFLTSKNRFVNRVEGGEIWAKQGNKLKFDLEELYSEDLY